VSSGVLFGGPTPEHDISILTGLQALRELSQHERDVRGVYWTKTGAYYLVDSDVEAEAFLDGVPKGSGELTLRLGDEGGFYAAVVVGSGGSTSTRWCSRPTGGRARTGRSRAPLISRVFPTADPPWPARRWAWISGPSVR
jgi:D-alanine-D-alanine ligase-like ATP-grasp enzyme